MNTAQHHVNSRAAQAGFTFIELMLTIVVVAVLASLAGPSMYEFVLNSRLTGTANEVLRTFQNARSEAVKRQRSVVVCMTANPKEAQPECATSNISGWITFQDDNNDWERAETEPLIETNTFESSKVFMLADESLRVSFASSGFAKPAEGVWTPTSAIVICDHRGNQTEGGQSTARGLAIAATGRARFTRVTSEINSLLTTIGDTCPP